MNIVAPRTIFTERDMVFRAKQTPGNFRQHVWRNWQDRSPCSASTTADAHCPQHKPPGWYSSRHRCKNLIGMLLFTSKNLSRKRDRGSRERPIGKGRIVENKP